MSNQSKTNPDNDNFSFVEAEHNVLNFWQENQIFEKSLDQTADQEPYIFYDGPPFATGLPHHGHLVGSILKDVVPRYFTMQGRYVQRRFGWDCHGVPIEHEIDKTLGMSSAEAVQTIGIKAYNGECRKIVQRYTSEWRKTITRLGRWVDFDNDYKTMEPWYMESVWWVFNQLWEKGLIYRGEKIVPFSTALGTVLSNFEAGSNYQDTQDPSVTVLFKLQDEDTYIAAWTTTPWTLPSNLALCVGDHIEYTKILDEESQKHIIIATQRLETLSASKPFSVVSSFPGKDLVGMRYESLFPYFESKRDQGAFQIVSDEYVSTESGTGIVHQAPAFGEDDFRILNAAGISAMACPIDMQGRFTDEVPDFQGLHVKEADKQIIRHLKQTGRLYMQDVIVHSYPFCPRSDTPLIYRAIDSWYVHVEKMRDQLIEVNQKINWVPEHIKNGRMGNWLAGSRDWAVSRNRYWGTPLPIWANDETNEYKCIGSIAELEQLTGAKVTDLHRENIDHLTFTVDGEPGTYRRIEEVLDCWFESGSMPYAHLHYPFENQAHFDKGFPAEFIAEGLDQTRGWFYTLIVLGNALFGTNAFNNVIVNGIVEAEDGKKMSKRLRNYTPPDDLMEQYGADALRLYLINSGLVKAEEQRFSDAGVKDMTRRALLPWLNAYRFLKTYASIDAWTPPAESKQSLNIMDQWILSRLQSLKARISEEMDQYHLYDVVPALFDFIEDLTNWYIRLNRSRFWDTHLSEDKQNAFQTLHTTLYEFSICMAPFAPFLAETIFAGLPKQPGTPESVHLCRYPKADPTLIEPLLEQAVERMQHIILLGRQKRNQEKVKTKYPLRKLTVVHKERLLLDEISRLESYLLAELNVKEIGYHDAEEDYITLFARPNSPVLGKRLGKDFKHFKTLIDQLDSDTILALQQQGSITLDETRFVAEDILVYREAKPGTNAISDRYISIDLDCHLDENLIQEGLAREVVSRIQKSRKDVGLNVVDRIDLSIHTDSVIQQAVVAHLDYIKAETLCGQLAFVEDAAIQPQLTYPIDEHSFGLTISKRH
ncbi:MAG: isoleucine--tRNA ligase [Gammaproteobacteria bacterium]|jgi:isoleucyl-tRNA synthetase|nr:isoleucine--tRNA ligase [Gammaproteobacteria bacterium]MBT5603945.1 isoleucine--tRNA ligase [Gammaproteobacteria bacterium]